MQLHFAAVSNQDAKSMNCMGPLGMVSDKCPSASHPNFIGKNGLKCTSTLSDVTGLFAFRKAFDTHVTKPICGLSAAND